MDPRIPRFHVETTRQAAAIRVRPVGELDLSTLDETQAAVDAALAASPDELVLDLGGLQFMDSSGLRLVIETVRAAEGANVTAVLVPGEEIVQRVFHLAGLLHRLPFREDPDGGA